MDVLCERGLLSSALNKFHNRLLLEDLMGIERGKELVLLIHQSHSYVSGTMMFVGGDGLTMARMKSFEELLNTNCDDGN